MEKKILVIGHCSSGALATIERIKEAVKERGITIVDSAEKLKSAYEDTGKSLNELAINITKLRNPDLPKPKSKYHN